MSRLERFALPDLGEGLADGEILRWLVAPGDVIDLNQPIVEVETAKAAVEVPSPFAGVVAELFHPEGATVDVGSALLSVETEPGTAGAGRPAGSAPASCAGASTEDDGASTEDVGSTGGGTPQMHEPTANLVGYGPEATVTSRRRRSRNGATAPVGASATEGPAGANGVARSDVGRVGGPGAGLAKPPVRKLARDLGVDLRTIAGTGPEGTILREDVMTAVGKAGTRPADAFSPPVPGVVTAAGFDAVTREMRIPVGGVRRHTATAMVASAFTAPHVSEFLTVDVSRTVEAVKRLRSMAGWEGVRVGPLLFVAKAIMLAIHRNPTVNATWVEDTQEIVVKDYVNLGIAVATRRGLVVPNVKASDQLTLRELADGISALVNTTRDGKAAPSDLVGGTITITNIGVFGVDSGTPILNPGEAMIVAFGQIAERPWVVDGEVVPRQVTTLSISFDHRVVDGEVASRFLSDVGTFLRDPEAALLAWA